MCIMLNTINNSVKKYFKINEIVVRIINVVSLVVDPSNGILLLYLMIKGMEAFNNEAIIIIILHLL